MLPEKEQFYEKATQKLLATIDKMEMDKVSRMRAKNLVLRFRDSFKLPDVKQKTFSDNYTCFTYDSDGFCYAASVDFALMMGGAPDWKIKHIGESWAHGPHHYLLHVPSNTVLDLTYDQFAVNGFEIPYNLGQTGKLVFEKDDSPARFAEAVGLTPLLANNKQKD